VDTLEPVVHQDADARVCRNTHGDQQKDDEVADEIDPAVHYGQSALGLELDGKEDEEGDVPEGAGDSTTAVDATIRVHLGDELASPVRKTVSPGAKDPEHGVDNVLVADKHDGEDVGRDGETGLLICDHALTLDERVDDEVSEREHVTEEGKTEDATVDGPKVPPQVAVQPGSVLGWEWGAVQAVVLEGVSLGKEDP